MHSDKYYFILFVVGVFFVSGFGGFLEGKTGFSGLDEMIICASSFLCIKKNKFLSKKIIVFLLIWTCLLIYSLIIKSNVYPAVFHSYLQLMKPFLLFLVIYETKLYLSDHQERFIYKMSILFGFLMPLIVFSTYTDENKNAFFLHMANYGNVMMITALCLFFSAKKNSRTLFLIFLLEGLICLRAKYYGEVIIAICFSLFLKNKLKVNLKYIFGFAIMCLVIIFFAWNKINIYVVNGDESIARVALYQTSFFIAKDFFPLGVGFGAFADDASRLFYSPIYYLYKLNYVWGLAPNASNFITDTYFPVVIGQFGAIGIFLLFMVFKFLKKNIDNSFDYDNKKNYQTSLIIVFVIVVESLAGSMITSYLGVSYILILANIINKSRCLNETKNLCQ